MRLVPVLLIVAACVSIFGCKDDGSDSEPGLCDRICEVEFVGEKEWADEWCDGFSVSDQEVMEGCVDSCNQYYDDLDEDEQEEVDDCFLCLLELIDSGEESEFGDIGEQDECECNTDGVGDFTDFYYDWMSEDMYNDPNESCM